MFLLYFSIKIDKCLAEFRFLKRLILVHGRYSYNRTAFLSQYSFYKSLLICFIQILWVSVHLSASFIIIYDCLYLLLHINSTILIMILIFCDRFSLISGMSGSSLFNSFSLMAYNVFYTSIPVLTSVLDKDLSENTVMQNPQILFYCQAGRWMLPQKSYHNSFLFSCAFLKTCAIWCKVVNRAMYINTLDIVIN